MKTHLIYLREAYQNLRYIGKRYELRDATRTVACVAIQEDGAASVYQMSSCSYLDVFEKPLARKIAQERLAKKPIACPLPVDGGFWNTTRTVVLDIANNLHNSKRTRAAAEAYLVEYAARQAHLATDTGQPGIH